MPLIKRRLVEGDTDFLEPMDPVLRRIYATRGVRSSDLNRELANLPPYHNLLGIENACAILMNALMHQKSILVIGDFDADGATSTVVALEALRAMGAKHVDYLVPNRFQYGYGLTPEIVQLALEKDPFLLITVDNGISSIEGVDAAQAAGLKVLITDHHLPGAVLPSADAIVNPNQPGDVFPSKQLAGVGVIFYVMLALRATLREHNWFQQQGLLEPRLADLLDLVAIGTVADVVQLDSVNRILVHQGLLRIRRDQTRPGVRALLKKAKRSVQHVVAADLGFAIGPRLNAAGRLADMSRGIECLLASEDQEALYRAEELEVLNQERKTIAATMNAQAMAAMESFRLEYCSETLPPALCLFDERWHQGVIGLLAGQLKEAFHRPVIVFAAVNETELKGSGRSIEGIHIRDVLAEIAAQYPGLIQKFGGHAMAAGLSIARRVQVDFERAWQETIQRHLQPEHLTDALWTDGELPKEYGTVEFAQALQDAGPWGQGFPEPFFEGYFQVLDQRLLADKHLKMNLQWGDRTVEAIAFNVDLTCWPNEDCKAIYSVYRLGLNTYGGLQRVQLVLELCTNLTEGVA